MSTSSTIGLRCSETFEHVLVARAVVSRAAPAMLELDAIAAVGDLLRLVA